MARRKHNAAVKRKLIAKGNNNVKMDRNADLKSYAGKEIRANRKYKDTVFRMLFSDRENLLSLYNAVNGSNYENSDALEIVTLENAVYMGMKNDLAFIVDYSCTNISQHTIQICHCEICFTYLVNTRNL